MKTRIEPRLRFWPKVNKTETCWLWTGAKSSAGYGQISDRGRALYAHRLAYEWLVTPIPEGLVIDHLCRVRHCVNPDHLEPVTQAENVRRGETGAASSARAKLQADCKHGHPFSGDNLHIYKGRRVCRTCQSMAWRRSRGSKVTTPRA